MHTNWERHSASLAIAGFANIVPGVRIPGVLYNISDLALKTMHTNAYEWFECIRDAYKNGENMEKWKAHPTRANIFINQEDGLMYERSNSGWHNMLPGQKMTELQELEAYRKADGVVRMTSRSRGKGGPPADQVPGEDTTNE